MSQILKTLFLNPKIFYSQICKSLYTLSIDFFWTYIGHYNVKGTEFDSWIAVRYKTFVIVSNFTKQ